MHSIRRSRGKMRDIAGTVAAEISSAYGVGDRGGSSVICFSFVLSCHCYPLEYCTRARWNGVGDAAVSWLCCIVS